MQKALESPLSIVALQELRRVEDVNEIFVYSGGNAGIAELALHLNDAHKVMSRAHQVLDGFSVVARSRLPRKDEKVQLTTWVHG